MAKLIQITGFGPAVKARFDDEIAAATTDVSMVGVQLESGQVVVLSTSPTALDHDDIREHLPSNFREALARPASSWAITALMHGLPGISPEDMKECTFTEVSLDTPPTLH